MSKKVLFISQYFPPDVTAAAFRVSETAQLMAEKGFDVTVLAANPHRSQVEGGESAEGKSEDYRVIRAPIYSGKEKFGKLGYLLHYFSFLLTSLVSGILKVPFDLDCIVVTSPPLPLGISAWLISKIRRTRLVLDVRDLWPDSVVSTGNIGKDGLFYKLGKKLEGFLYERADAITCVSKPMRGEIISSGKIGKYNVHVMYNGLYEKGIDNGATSSSLSVMKENNLTVTYLGNMGNAQNLDVVLKAGDILSDASNQDIEFLLVGGGVCKDDLREKIRSQEIQNVRLAGPVEKSEVFVIMEESSALLIHLKESEAFTKTIPSKVFDYLYANKPILYGIQGEGKEILDNLSGNLYFQQGNSKSLAETVEELAGNYEDLASKAQSNRAFVVNNYSRKEMTEKLVTVIEGLN